MSDTVLQWLTEGDPAIRWQVERDLLRRDPEVWEATRSEIGEIGWGKRLLDEQDVGGTWGLGLYGPKWTSTTYTLLLLRRFGLLPSNPQAVAGCRRLLDDARWIDGGVSLFTGDQLAEKCVNGMVLSLVSYFDADDSRVDSIAEMLLTGRLADGGWNCEDFRGTTHSSFHTTISVLEGLQEWKRRTKSRDADGAITSGQEFMLRHRMDRSHRTGEVINKAWSTFHFPPRWHYDVLRGLDHLQDAGALADPRAGEAIALVLSKRRKDGRWGKGSQYSGRVYFVLEPNTGPGRWNTLRALRVLNWWSQNS
ncbi:MAG: hypothetical protein DWP92_01045 [Armatimonadetes bacterium]|nr:MAG: hypothetical protein DWP92_01045 [Armatimonadota bacterium]